MSPWAGGTGLLPAALVGTAGALRNVFQNYNWSGTCVAWLKTGKNEPVYYTSLALVFSNDIMTGTLRSGLQQPSALYSCIPFVDCGVRGVYGSHTSTFERGRWLECRTNGRFSFALQTVL